MFQCLRNAQQFHAEEHGHEAKRCPAVPREKRWERADVGAQPDPWSLPVPCVCPGKAPGMRRAHFASCVLFQKRSITNVRDGYTTQRGGEGFAVKTSDTVVNILYLPAQGLKGFPSCSGSPRGSPGRGAPEHSGPLSSPRVAARPHSVSAQTPRWC